MYKFIAILLVPILISVIGISDNLEKSNQENSAVVKSMKFSDLTESQKTEAIEYFKSTGSCEYKGIKLYGKVQFVTNFPDIKIELSSIAIDKMYFSDIFIVFILDFNKIT